MARGILKRLFGKKPAPSRTGTTQDPRYHSVSPEAYFADPNQWEAAPSTSHLEGWAYYGQGAGSELRVKFRNGPTYFYLGVPRVVYEGFRKAAHPGSFGHSFIWYSYTSGKL